jgi:hypothetical protein
MMNFLSFASSTPHVDTGNSVTVFQHVLGERDHPVETSSPNHMKGAENLAFVSPNSLVLLLCVVF